MINTQPHFDAFSTGRKAFREHEGTWRDAEDGELHGGAITEGSVDSTIGVHFRLDGGETQRVILLDRRGHDARRNCPSLTAIFLERRPLEFLDYTANYWHAWVNKNDVEFGDLPEDRRSLQTLAADHQHADRRRRCDPGRKRFGRNRACDRSLQLSLDARRCVCRKCSRCRRLPRDGTPAFMIFAVRSFIRTGYFLQKYNPDGTVASGWHASWDNHGKTTAAADTGRRDCARAVGVVAALRQISRHRFRHRCYRRLVVTACARFYGRVSRSENAVCRCRVGTSGKIAAAFIHLRARLLSRVCVLLLNFARAF